MVEKEIVEKLSKNLVLFSWREVFPAFLMWTTLAAILFIFFLILSSSSSSCNNVVSEAIEICSANVEAEQQDIQRLHKARDAARVDGEGDTGPASKTRLGVVSWPKRQGCGKNSSEAGRVRHLPQSKLLSWASTDSSLDEHPKRAWTLSVSIRIQRSLDLG